MNMENENTNTLPEDAVSYNNCGLENITDAKKIAIINLETKEVTVNDDVINPVTN